MGDLSKAKVLLFDIETSPNISYTWGKWEQNVIAFKQEWQIMSIAWKWLGKKTQALCLADYTCKDDKRLCEKLYDLLNEADVIIAHNGDAFDIKKAKARFLFHRLPPTKQFLTIDTKKVAKKHFSFNSNSLDDLGNYLELGRKVKHEGFELWLKCLAGDKAAWKRMKEYNIGDVELLERVYQKLRPWIESHPNIALIEGQEGCPNCGHPESRSDGIRYTKTRRYRRLRCTKCFRTYQGCVVK